jgi:hypothetical protein
VGREESVRKGAKDVKKEKDIKEREVVEKVLRALDSDRTESRLSLKEVERVVRDLGLVGDDPKAIAALAREALSKARNRIRETLEGLRESLGISSPLPSRLAKILERGRSLLLVTPRNLPGHVQVEAEWDEVFLHTPFPVEIWPPIALAGSKGGDVAFNAGIPYAVFARRGRVSFYFPDHQNTERAHKVVQAFRPLFRVLGLDDLEGAFEALTALKDGEARMEGAYVLARRGDRWALRRGSLFGNPLLDKAFLLGEEDLVFSYPEGLSIAFTTDPVGYKVRIKAIKVWWGEEVASYYPSLYRGPAPEAEVIDEGLPGTLIQMGLREWLGKPMRPKYSPRMEVLLRELSESQNPLEAPKEPDFFRRVHLQALAKF